MEVNRRRNNKLRCAVLDTNVLMYIYLEKVDVLPQLEYLGFSKVFVPQTVVDELNRLKVSLTGKERLAANFALRLIESGEIEVIETEKKGDSALLEVAEKYGCYLITNDKSLRRRARDLGIPFGYIREMNRVEIVE